MIRLIADAIAPAKLNQTKVAPKPRIGILLKSIPNQYIMQKVLFIITLMAGLALASGQDRSVLWYETHGTDWETALPIGTGRLGGLISGSPAEESIAISEETVWSGEPHDYTNKGAHEYLKELQALILAEKYEEAAAFGKEHSLGVPVQQEKFQALGNLKLRFPGHGNPKNYRRSLNMSKGLAHVQYMIGDATYTREIFASYPDQVIAIRISCDQPGRITFTASMDSLHEKHDVETIGENGLALLGRSDAIEFRSQIKATTDGGKVHTKAKTLQIEKADSVVLFISAATNYVRFDDISADPAARCRDYLQAVEHIPYENLKKRHVADFSSLYDRVSLDLGAKKKELATPTNELIEQIAEGKRSPLIEEQLYQFGRYLTISGARPGTMPLNLVGIWPVDGLVAPWGGKWTLNINAQMNTWPAETAALAECHKPLLQLLEDLRITGRRVAKEHYNARGFVAHHNTDLWRGAAPVDTSVHGLWTLGSAWLTRHIWEHYDFSRDEAYLREAYATLKEAALFYQDFLIEGPDGYLATSPAISFEQTFIKPDGTVGRLTYAPTMDNQILRDLFENCISAAETLETDTANRLLWRTLIDNLRPNQIDPKTGRIMEWAFPAEQKPISGQLPPLWGLSPGREITPQGTPEIADACVDFLEYITPHIPEYQTTGSWITGTHLNSWARLGRGEKAYGVINKVMSEKLAPNLMMKFYGKDYFQIDGNMGTTAGVTEMLIQSHRLTKDKKPIIDLLPALSAKWPKGSANGIRARGAFTIDIAWSKGELDQVAITSRKGVPLNLAYGEQTRSISTTPGETYIFNSKLELKQ